MRYFPDREHIREAMRMFTPTPLPHLEGISFVSLDHHFSESKLSTYLAKKEESFLHLLLLFFGVADVNSPCYLGNN